MAADQADQPFVIDVARSSDDRARPDVASPVLGEQRAAGHGLDHIGTTEHRPAQGMVAEDRPADEIVHEVLRGILDHRDLLEDDLALRVEIGERGRVHHVGHDVERRFEVLVHHARVHDRVLPGGDRVQLAAEPVEDLRDVLRGVGASALEQEVLEEMAHARPGIVLVARSAPDPEADRDRPDAVEPLRDHPLAVVERCQLVVLHRATGLDAFDPVAAAGASREPGEALDDLQWPARDPAGSPRMSSDRRAAAPRRQATRSPVATG